MERSGSARVEEYPEAIAEVRLASFARLLHEYILRHDHSTMHLQPTRAVLEARILEASHHPGLIAPNASLFCIAQFGFPTTQIEIGQYQNLNGMVFFALTTMLLLLQWHTHEGIYHRKCGALILQSKNKTTSACQAHKYSPLWSLPWWCSQWVPQPVDNCPSLVGEKGEHVIILWGSSRWAMGSLCMILTSTCCDIPRLVCRYSCQEPHAVGFVSRLDHFKSNA